MTTTAPRSLTSRRPIYGGSRIPSPTPTVLTTTPEMMATGDVLTINFGPNHPSTHGVLRLVLPKLHKFLCGLYSLSGRTSRSLFRERI